MFNARYQLMSSCYPAITSAHPERSRGVGNLTNLSKKVNLRDKLKIFLTAILRDFCARCLGVRNKVRNK